MSVSRSVGVAHTMDGRTGVAAWPPIGLAELQALVPSAPCLRGSLQVLWHSPRPFSSAALVQSSDGIFLVKRVDARVRDVEGVLEEHAFLVYLRARGAAVPEMMPLRGPDGLPCSAVASGRWIYEVQARAPGEDVYGEAHSWSPLRSPGHARALGAALAHLHRAAEGYDAPQRPARPLSASFDIIGAADPTVALDRFLARRPVVARYLDGGYGGERPPGREAILAALRPWHEELRPWLAALPPLWVHNDVHASNAFWTSDEDDAQVSCLIDFGLCNRGCALADLATALERNTIAWLDLAIDPLAGSHAYGSIARGIGRLPLALALLAGYHRVRPLSPAERAALPWLLPLAHLEFALSEVDYFCGVVQDLHNAALAHPGFTLGHVHWFGGREGRQYLDGIRAALVGGRAADAPWPAS